MKNEAMISAIAELDGWRRFWNPSAGGWVISKPDGSVDYCDPDPNADYELHRLPPYLTSRDAIVPVIEKHSVAIQEDVLLHLVNIHNRMIMHGTRFTDFTEWRQQTIIQFQTTPSQLCEALLRATGKWVE